ncbi:Uncharacterized conserved protein YegP, UPF0339 family [Roseomonas rosea]|uniref:Uncharacterized conserved protein YegP, UPF0339 family n=1 Tax=Muricoccus roseus TaxID=198092 RepID=A0A1M6SDE5_9PROT|nr:DUF1508 domain-containing protein [Roseomonas rosea]SHK42730.1 Uncharacterized conserved protein YegP, UPF0339 family [Roseomonas rosea]
MYFTINKNAAGYYYWNLKAANHEIIAQSETYVSKAGCQNAINLVKSTNISTPTRDNTN